MGWILSKRPHWQPKGPKKLKCSARVIFFKILKIGLFKNYLLPDQHSLPFWLCHSQKHFLLQVQSCKNWNHGGFDTASTGIWVLKLHHLQKHSEQGWVTLPNTFLTTWCPEYRPKIFFISRGYEFLCFYVFSSQVVSSN